MNSFKSKAAFSVLGLSLLSLTPNLNATCNNGNSHNFHIVRCCTPSTYEKVLLTKLRDVNTSMEDFRSTLQKIAALLVNKVVRCLPTKPVDIASPIGPCTGVAIDTEIELLSIMRSGDALLETFMQHFPKANVSKILIQRDEETAKPHFIYKKLSPTIASGNYIVITEPAVASGGTMDMTISLLKEIGVQEEKIIIACVIAAPEGLQDLNQKYPKINIVMTALDEKLNERKYIVPGLGDCGDRYFGTQH